ncbi:MAG: IPT/TIG domain-containing protein [Spirochaetales bacterium]|nr:IPT/TIG domain-containing protein [Spirochaetales bacterium]MCF7937191.1 IPT/TIG domain-containing protein [Spirochaetales bacterium]
MENQQTGNKRTIRKIIPILLFIVVAIIFVFSSRLTGAPPEISSVSPDTGRPGDIIVIEGENFGNRPGQVSFSGFVPTSSAYRQWEPNRIRLSLPEGIQTGLIQVKTDSGTSNGLLFADERDIPEVVESGTEPGVPFINSLQPQSGSIGTPVSIRGGNFGVNRDGARVLFTWMTEDQTEDQTRYVACSPDLDYLNWSDEVIEVLVPDGASTGNVLIETGKGKSNQEFFEVDGTFGEKVFSDKTTYAMSSRLLVTELESREEGTLYLWYPGPAPAPQQRNIQILDRSRKPVLENFNGLMLFSLSGEDTGESPLVISQTIMFDRYEVSVRVDDDRYQDYRRKDPLYRRYTRSNDLVPSDAEAIQTLSDRITGRFRSPHRKAERIFRYLIDTCEFVQDSGSLEPEELVEAEQLDALGYAVLYSALARAAGIPARPVSGYYVDERGGLHRHYWSEHYLQGVGWVPSDIPQADNARIGGVGPVVPPEAADSYFGILDNRHIALTRGLVEAGRMDPSGRIATNDFSFQAIHEEASGPVESYSTEWPEYELIGIY